jgi:hypothetical protein
MKKQVASVLYSFVCLFALVNLVYAADESPVDTFLGSPLLILVALIIIAVIFFIYYKIRK